MAVLTRFLTAPRSVLLPLAALVLFVTTTPAIGAEDLLKRGRDLLRNATTQQTTSAGLSNEDIVAGLKEALAAASGKVVTQLGKTDGFNLDPAIHIPLPAQMDRIKSALEKVGMGQTFTDLELKLNRAAEQATPVAKDLFLQSIRNMSLSDAGGILRGGDTAATDYFRRTMSPELATKMQPIVQQALAQVGAVAVFDQVIQRYNSLPLVTKQNINLNDYVVQKAMDGTFLYMGKQETAIRKDPVARTTDLLKKVFGAR